MKPVANWRAVLRRAWSLRLMALAAILSGVEVALPFLSHLVSVPAGAFAALSGVTTAAAFAARLIAQKDIAHENQT